MAQDGVEVAFVPFANVAEWKAAGWRVSGPMPNSHAIYFVVMERDGPTRQKAEADAPEGGARESG